MSRNSRLTADVSLEAHNLLRGYADKHERSKGFLLEKMIRKFCVEPDAGGVPPEQTEQQKVMAEYVKPKAPVKRFIPPRVDEVSAYMFERTNQLTSGECDKFCDFYESNGWKVGKNKMKCWKAAVRNWLKNNNGKKDSKNILQDSSNSDWHLKEDTGF